MSKTPALLDEIAKLQAAQDAAGLKALEDHADKAVRKARRQAKRAGRMARPMPIIPAVSLPS